MPSSFIRWLALPLGLAMLLVTALSTPVLAYGRHGGDEGSSDMDGPRGRGHGPAWGADRGDSDRAERSQASRGRYGGRSTGREDCPQCRMGRSGGPGAGGRSEGPERQGHYGVAPRGRSPRGSMSSGRGDDCAQCRAGRGGEGRGERSMGPSAQGRYGASSRSRFSRGSGGGGGCSCAQCRSGQGSRGGDRYGQGAPRGRGPGARGWQRESSRR